MVRVPLTVSDMISSFELSDEYQSFILNSNIDVFCPFITTDVMKNVIKYSSKTKRIVVRWRPEDFISGYADLGLYELTKANYIDLYYNHRIHLKATLRDDKNVFHSSANLTHSGMNIDRNETHNYELSTIIQEISNQDLIYFEQIVQDSVYVDDQVFEKLKIMVNSQENLEMNEPEEPYLDNKKAFYISQLPQTLILEDLFRFYTEKPLNELAEKCAVHDLAIYQVKSGLSEEEFWKALSDSFFSHPFIKMLFQTVEDEGFIYFGRVKDWIQNNCVNTPVPGKRELTGVVQVLYKWVEVLGKDKYVVDKPNHSQRIKVLD